MDRQKWRELLTDPAKRARLLLGLLAAVAVFGTYWAIPQRKSIQKVKVRVSLTPPPAMAMEENAKPHPLHVHFSGSAAPLQDVGKAVARGVTLSPRVPGVWKWASDSELVFTPKEDWAVSQDYSLMFERKFFPDHVIVDKSRLQFRSASFSASVSHGEFYQDPKNPKIKKAVWTLTASHPLDSSQFSDLVSLSVPKEKAGLFGSKTQAVPFTVAYSDLKDKAFIYSHILPIPPQDSAIELTIKGGVRSSRGGNTVTNGMSWVVAIPGMFNYFKVAQAEIGIARNERYEPEHVLLIHLSAGAGEKSIQKHFSAWLLPVDRPAINGRPESEKHYWNASEVGPQVLALSEGLKLKPLATDKEFAALHSFKIEVPARRHVYLKITKGVEAYGGYVLAREYSTVLRAPELPRELTIMGEGSLLSLSGEKKVSIASRGIDNLRFEIGRLIPGQLNHLISQTAGNIKNPSFKSWTFNQDDITERFVETRAVKTDTLAKTLYSALDLSAYLLSADGGPKRGVFFLKVEAWDPVHKRPAGPSDQRLLLVTDLGVVVKNNKDGSRDVFVQSVHTGEPVAGASVQVIGRNGLAVLGDATDSGGRASFPSLADFEREKEPTAYLIKKGGDTSFIPFDWSDRKLNFSRFDTGGLVADAASGGMTAYLFSDRGIYRPGEEFHVGAIVKAADWGQDLSGIPLEATVSDARGLEVYKRKLNLSAAGFEDIAYKTEDGSPTGQYHVSIFIVKDNRRAALLGSTSIRVEEFLPDRLKIVTRLSQERTEGWVSPAELRGLVNLKNLFGTQAEKRRVSAQIKLTPAPVAFSRFRDYFFLDPKQAKKIFSERLDDAETNQDGDAQFDLGLDRFEDGTYRLTFSAEGFEADGGRSVGSETGALVSSLDKLIGFKPDGELRFMHKGSPRSVHLIAVDSALNKREASSLTAHVVEQRWVSVLQKQENGTYKYESILKEILQSKKELSIPAAGLKYALPTAQPGDFALVIKDENEVELARVPFSVVGRANLTRALDRNAELQIKLSKADYAPGEEIELEIKAPYTGAGLITIERDKVYAHRWFKTGTTSSMARIRVPAGLEGNAYVNVAFVRSPDSREIFMSPLSYGVAPFSLSRARRTNPVQLEITEISRPGEPYRIKYRADQPAKIVIFGADEGILQVAGYKTPDPLSHFFAKRALEVETAQILDLLLPEFNLVRSLSSAGGDEGREALGKNLNPFKRRRDRPAVYWSGIIDAGPETREAVYSMPDSFNGTFRVMAVAVSREAIGVAERKSIVRAHFTLSPNAPTVAAPGDEFIVSVGAANNVEGSGKDLPILIRLAASEGLELLDGSERKVAAGEGRETTASFRVRAKAVLGSQNLTFTALGADKMSRASFDLSVRPPVPFRTVLHVGFVKDGKVEVPVERALYPHYRLLETLASPLPLGLARGLVNYLGNYPHLCTEQLLSAAMPVVALKGRPELGYDAQKGALAFENALGILRSRQNAEGAFGFWAANSHVSDFHAVYAMHFLTEAKEKGFNVPNDVVARGLVYLRNLTTREDLSGLHDARIRAYAAYILSRNGVVTTDQVASLRERLDREQPEKWQKDLTGIYIAAALKLLQQDRQAWALIRRSQLGDPQASDYRWFYDSLMRDSQLLYILSRHFPERVKDLAPDQLRHIFEPIGEGRYNSLSSASTLLALDAYASVAGTPSFTGLIVSERRRDGKILPLEVPGGLFPKTLFSELTQAVRIRSKSDFPIFYQVTEAGFDTSMPKEVKNGVEVRREFRDESGNVVTSTKLGSQLAVHLKVRAVGNVDVDHLAFVDLLPGGFEADINDIRLPASHGSFSPEYVDIREDRVVVYGRASSDEREFIYTIKATNRGTFQVPPAFAESMYDRGVQALSSHGKIVVE